MSDDESVNSVVVKYATKGVNKVTSASQQVRDSVRKTAEATNTASQTQKDAMFRVMGSLTTVWGYIISKTPALKAQMKSIGKSSAMLAKSLGKTLVPAFQGLSRFLRFVATTFRSLPGPMKSFIAMSFALTSGLLVLTTAATSTATALGGMAAVLGVSLTTIGLVVAAVALLYVAWKNNFLGIQQITKQVVAWLRKQVTKFVAFVRPLWRRFVVGLRKLWGVHGGALKKELGATMTFLGNVISGFISGTKPIWKTGLRIMAAVTKASFAIIKTRILTVMDAIVTAIRVGLALLRGDWKKAGNLVLGFVKRTASRIEGLADRLVNIFDGLAASAYRWGKDLIGEFISGINSKIAHFQQKVDELKNTVEKSMSFDRVKNDRMAQRWGADLVDHFSRGMARKSGQLQGALPSRQSDSFGLHPAGGGGNRTTVNVTVEAGAVQMRGGSTARVNAEKTAEGVAEEFAQRMGRRS